MPLERKLSWLPGILSGLKALHRKGYLHRDIKPENIYFKADGEPMLIDFGASLNALGARNNNLSVLLTPDYSPIEQRSNKADVQGPWTDIYSLGATLYFCLTGETPTSAKERQTAISDHEPDPLDKDLEKLFKKRKISPGLKAALIGSLKFSRKNRLQGVKEFSLALYGPSENESARQEDIISPKTLGTPQAPQEELNLISTPVAPPVKLETRFPNLVPPPPQTPAATPEMAKVEGPLLNTSQPKSPSEPSPSISRPSPPSPEKERFLPTYILVNKKTGKPKIYGVMELVFFYFFCRVFIYTFICAFLIKLNVFFGVITLIIILTASIYLIYLYHGRTKSCIVFNDLIFAVYSVFISLFILLIDNKLLLNIFEAIIFIIIDIVFYLLVVIYMHTSRQVAYTFSDYRADPKTLKSRKK
jgi:serine/threonine protein kinase